MFILNEELMVREDDKSLFSLSNMEVYEFNKAGFDALMIIKNTENGISYDDWEISAKKIDGIDSEEIHVFWDGLVEQGIIVEVK